MPTCKDCKFYNPKGADSGDCFGHRVEADKPSDECPVKAFQKK